MVKPMRRRIILASWRLAVSTLSVLAAFSVTAAAQAPLEFEVASIKRNTSGDLSNPVQTLPSGEIRVMNTPVRNLILRAYPLSSLPIQVLGLPGWAEIQGERYNVIARSNAGATAEEQQQMWRALFADRMKLAAHYETRDQAGYRRVFAKVDHVLGPGLKPTTLDCANQPALPRPEAGVDLRRLAMNRCGFFFVEGDTIYSGGSTIGGLIRMMVPAAGRPIADRTGLPGFYSVVFRFQRIPSRTAAVPSLDDPPSLLTAVQEQLGLKLESDRAQAQVLVVDHIERPTEN